jgi:NADH dehydrogenase FAD-containing subunit
MNDAAQPPCVVVIGGGYGGVNVARALDDVAQVTLVEPKDAW